MIYTSERDGPKPDQIVPADKVAEMNNIMTHVLTEGTGRGRADPRLDDRRQDRHDQQLDQRLVQRLHRQSRRQRLVRQRRRLADGRHDRRHAAGAELEGDHGLRASRPGAEAAVRRRRARRRPRRSPRARPRAAPRPPRRPRARRAWRRKTRNALLEIGEFLRRAGANEPRPPPSRTGVANAAPARARLCAVSARWLPCDSSQSPARRPRRPRARPVGDARGAVRRLLPIAVDQLGQWRIEARAGAADADPYTRARVERDGEIPLGLGEGLRLTTREDSEGRALDPRLRLPIRPACAAGALLDAGGGRRRTDFPLENAADRYVLRSSEILREPDGGFSIWISPRAHAGNWLPVGGRAPFALALRLVRSRAQRRRGRRRARRRARGRPGALRMSASLIARSALLRRARRGHRGADAFRRPADHSRRRRARRFRARRGAGRRRSRPSRCRRRRRKRAISPMPIRRSRPRSAVYDLAGGPVRARAPLGRAGFASLSFHSRRGVVFYALTDRAANKGRMDALIVTPEQLRTLVAHDDEDNPTEDLRIVSPTPKGFVMARVLSESPDDDAPQPPHRRPR